MSVGDKCWVQIYSASDVCLDPAEITFVNGLTSSSESACLNIRIALLELTKGKDRVVMMPTLATVSLKKDHQCIRDIG